MVLWRNPTRERRVETLEKMRCGKGKNVHNFVEIKKKRKTISGSVFEIRFTRIKKPRIPFGNVGKSNVFQQEKNIGEINAFSVFHYSFHKLWKSRTVNNTSDAIFLFRGKNQENSLQMLLISYSNVLSLAILLLITSMEERMVVWSRPNIFAVFCKERFVTLRMT